jgi:hypothetical protein
MARLQETSLVLVASETSRSIADLDLLLGCMIFTFSEMGVVDLQRLFMADCRGRFG